MTTVNTLHNAGKAWTHEEEDQLAKMFNAGKGLEEIAAEVGRTPVAVVGRMVDIGILEVRGQRGNCGNYFPRATEPWAVWQEVKELQEKVKGG